MYIHIYIYHIYIYVHIEPLLGLRRVDARVADLLVVVLCVCIAIDVAMNIMIINDNMIIISSSSSSINIIAIITDRVLREALLGPSFVIHGVSTRLVCHIILGCIILGYILL